MLLHVSGSAHTLANLSHAALYAFAVYTRKKVSVTDLRWRFGIMSIPSMLNIIGWYKLYSHAYCIVVRSEFAYIVNNSEAIK